MLFLGPQARPAGEASLLVWPVAELTHAYPVGAGVAARRYPVKVSMARPRGSFLGLRLRPTGGLSGSGRAYRSGAVRARPP